LHSIRPAPSAPTGRERGHRRAQHGYALELITGVRDFSVTVGKRIGDAFQAVG
jgi:hypothetical protein